MGIADSTQALIAVQLTETSIVAVDTPSARFTIKLVNGVAHLCTQHKNSDNDGVVFHTVHAEVHTETDSAVIDATFVSH